MLELRHADAERGQNHHVAGRHVREAFDRIARIGEDVDAHRLDALVDVGVVNDFAGEKHAAIGKLPAGLIRVIHGAVDAVTKAEFFRELEVETAGTRFIAHGLEAFDDGALVGTRQNRSDLGFQAETLLEIHFRST